MKLLGRFFTLTCIVILATLTLLLPVLPASAAIVTDVTLSEMSGPPGTLVTITGHGFTAASYTVAFGGITVIPSTPVPAGGTISDYFVVPTLPRTGSPYSVVVTAVGDIVNIPIFAITPVVWLSSSSGLVGDEIKVSGSGFLANTTVTIGFDGTSITSLASDANGMFADENITIPDSTAGWHTISGRDYVGAAPGAAFVISPRIVVSTTTGTVGSTISCSGNGFAASKSVSFTLDETAISDTATTNSSGTFGTTTFTVPAISGGNHVLKASDSSGNSATADITVNASVSITPVNGPAGTTIAVAGSGFQANGTIGISYNGVNVTTVPSPVSANSSGSFTASFTASALPAGVYSVVVSDGARTVTAQFTSIATATMTASGGKVGTSITAAGTGFKPKSAIYANLDDTQIAIGATDLNGNFTFTFDVPSASTGVHEISLTDKINTLKFNFTIAPSFSIDPESGFIGTEITISGTGFTANRTVTFKYDSEQLSSTSTGADGAFTVLFKAPVSKGGNHTITFSDGTTTFTATFVMDATPPAVPQLLLPPSLTKALSLATFDWQDSPDPSGVTYTLQVATDETFFVLVLQQQGLTDSSYALKENESLKSVSKKTPYYWRVKAIDAASNESAWSTPYTFYVGFVLADWVQYVFFGVVAVLFGVTGYLLAMLRYRPKPPAKQGASESVDK